jgi:hypothetical protein
MKLVLKPHLKVSGSLDKYCHEHVSEIKNVNEEIHTCLQIVVMLIDCSKVNWSGDLLYHVKHPTFMFFFRTVVSFIALHVFSVFTIRSLFFAVCAM